MSTARRVLGSVVAGLAGVAFVATPASAHTGSFTRDCEAVHVKLINFPESSEDDPNVVHILRDGKELDELTFTDSSAEESYDEKSDGKHTYTAVWKNTGKDDHSGKVVQQLGAPKDCEPEESEPPAEKPPASEPPAEKSPSEEPPASEPPATTPPAAAPPAVPPATPVANPPVEEPPSLPKTGIDGAVMIGIAGAILLAGGAGLLVLARRRRTSNE